MDAINAAILRVQDGDTPPDMVREGYVQGAQNMLASGLTEQQVIDKFNALKDE